MEAIRETGTNSTRSMRSIRGLSIGLALAGSLMGSIELASYYTTGSEAVSYYSHRNNYIEIDMPLFVKEHVPFYIHFNAADQDGVEEISLYLDDKRVYQEDIDPYQEDLSFMDNTVRYVHRRIKSTQLERRINEPGFHLLRIELTDQTGEIKNAYAPIYFEGFKV